MRKVHFLSLAFSTSLMIFGAVLPYGSGSLLSAREKTPFVNPNDPTVKLYALLDTKHDGKLEEFYFLGDVFKDASHPDQEWQHVILAEYNKNLFFGRFKMTVRSISKPTPDQLKAYTVKALYDFGSDSARFAKIDPGTFGQKGDLYMVVAADKPIASAPITPEVQATYEKYVSQYLLPALEKEKD
jgi:hypothetical protein